MPSLNVIYDEIDGLETDDQEYIISVVQSRIRDRKRTSLEARAKEALSIVEAGNVKSGGFKELWADLND